MSNALAAKGFSVGLTGGIGSGKTVVAELFAARGVAVVDTDHIARRLTASGGIAIAAIRAQFGNAFFTPAGAMDRAKMRETVFTNPAAKKQLESILHPLIRSETEQAGLLARGAYLMLVIPLLVETETWKQQTSRVLVVDCTEQQQVMRVMQRNALTKAQVHAIMATQASREARLAAADDVIVNEGERGALLPQIDRLHALYSSLAKKN